MAGEIERDCWLVVERLRTLGCWKNEGDMQREGERYACNSVEARGGGAGAGGGGMETTAAAVKYGGLQ